MWSRWVTWASVNHVSSSAPRSIQFANFLAYLFSVLHLSPSSVRLHRSAIRTTIRQLGGPSLSSSTVRDVIRGVNASQASHPRRMPLWDLSLVLVFLRSDLFRPQNSPSLRLLTLKACFLVTLATAFRSCEVHGLSGLPADVSSESDGSMSVRFLPEFRAKTKSVASSSPVIIQPLASRLASDDDDRFLCPVLALKRYLRRSRPLRGPNLRRLFVSFNPGYQFDIRKSTVSRWLTTVIQEAYKSASLDVTNPRAHEVRALSASLALERNVPIQVILDAASWKSVLTFTSFYLRDISRTRGDNSSGISSAVVAQYAVSTSFAASSI